MKTSQPGILLIFVGGGFAEVKDPGVNLVSLENKPVLSMFTLGDGRVHCQALKSDSVEV